MVTYIMCSVKTVHSVRKRTDRGPYKPEIGSFTRVLSNAITSHPLLERAFILFNNIKGYKRGTAYIVSDIMDMEGL